MKYALLTFFATSCISGIAQKDLVFSDKVYEPQIKTVQLYPDQGGAQDYLNAPATPLNKVTLVVEFDDLQANRNNNYYAKIYHCNYDWTKSNLMDLDYLSDYNEYPVNDYSFSVGTQLPYVHYKFPIPLVKIAGNYLLIVYRNSPSDLILSKRFMVFSNVVTLTRDPPTGTGALSFTTQQINFVLDYSEIEVLNPLENIHVVIRQNQRWDNSKVDVKPSFLRDADNQMEFRSFDSDKQFTGGNEFRFVDFRSVLHPGLNTGKMNRTVKPLQLSVQQDLTRAGQPYAQYNDRNGNYLMENQDGGDPKTNSNYVNVTFSLSTPEKLNDPVYVIGAFNAWDHNSDNLMTYDPDRTAYERTILLKQGMYDYQYLVDSKTIPDNYFEGDHFETENVYEISVYNHEFQRGIDVLVGYVIIPMNPR